VENKHSQTLPIVGPKDPNSPAHLHIGPHILDFFCSHQKEARKPILPHPPNMKYAFDFNFTLNLIS
tara:strand:+ start:21 stop:218 length:198 start_codon:yes stop_codon:yes gene_type:complete